MTSPVELSTLPPHLLGWQNAVSSQSGTGLAPPALPFPPRTQNDQDPDASAGAQEQVYHGGFPGGFLKGSLLADVFNSPRPVSSLRLICYSCFCSRVKNSWTSTLAFALPTWFASPLINLMCSRRCRSPRRSPNARVNRGEA